MNVLKNTNISRQRDRRECVKRKKRAARAGNALVIQGGLATRDA
ncbi:MAG: hypothetical protein ACRECW_12840 [Phyllobacterium sp.]